MQENIGGHVMSENVSMQETEKFVGDWVAAGGSVVQDWFVWEELAAKALFGEEPGVMTTRSNAMHQVMLIAVAVCTGTVGDVKRAVRETTPATLELARKIFGHLHHFSAVLDAEFRFRLGELASDWTLESDGTGRCIVRSEFRSRDTEH